MAKALKDILKGVKSSTKKTVSTGDDPGVDYSPKAKAERDFEGAHEVEVHDDRVGNDGPPYKAVKNKEATYKKQKPSVYEDVEQIDEISKGKVSAYLDKANASTVFSNDELEKERSKIFSGKNVSSQDIDTHRKNIKKDNIRAISKYTANKKLTGSAKVNATEELENILEITTKLAKNYKAKANKDADSADADVKYFKSQGQDYDAGEAQKRLDKREKGIELAGKKIKGSMDVNVLTKEEAEE